MAKDEKPSGGGQFDNSASSRARVARAPKRKPGDHMSDEERREAQAKFLTHFRDKCIIRRAAEHAGIDRSLVDYWRKHDKSFARRWEQAELDAADRLRDEIDRRAVEGWEEPLVSGGQIVYEQEPVLNEDGSPVTDKYGRVKYQRGRMLTVRKYDGALIAKLATWRLPEAKPKPGSMTTEVETAEGVRVRAVFVMPEVDAVGE